MMRLATVAHASMPIAAPVGIPLEAGHRCWGWRRCRLLPSVPVRQVPSATPCAMACSAPDLSASAAFGVTMVAALATLADGGFTRRMSSGIVRTHIQGAVDHLDR